jgi:hypothetical protein
MSVVPALERQRQEDLKFKVSLGWEGGREGGRERGRKILLHLPSDIRAPDSPAFRLWDLHQHLTPPISSPILRPSPGAKSCTICSFGSETFRLGWNYTPAFLVLQLSGWIMKDFLTSIIT